MALKRKATSICIAVALVSSAWLGYEGWRMRQTRQFNAALERSDFAQAAQHDSAHGRFAKAYLWQAQERYQDALKLYHRLAKETEPAAALAQAAKYNMANAYLQQALSLNDEGEDLALPLVELAKQSYRELLRLDSGHWNAKYNLERALQFFPDPREQAVQEWQAPERSPRAVVSTAVDRQLP